MPIPFDLSRIVAPACHSILPFTPDLAESRMEVARAPIMFEKTLTHSDTSGGGRIVIPKAIAETHFPSIDDPSGYVVPVVDVFGETRGLRFRYWVNNSSRMYILEGVGPLLKLFKLSVGDVLIFGKDEDDHLVICGRKVGFIIVIVIIIFVISTISLYARSTPTPTPGHRRRRRPLQAPQDQEEAAVPRSRGEDDDAVLDDGRTDGARGQVEDPVE